MGYSVICVIFNIFILFNFFLPYPVPSVRVGRNSILSMGIVSSLEATLFLAWLTDVSLDLFITHDEYNTYKNNKQSIVT